jgi:hypothetical protein
MSSAWLMDFSDLRSQRAEQDKKFFDALNSPELTDDEKKIVRILGAHRGAVNAIRSSSIAELLRIGQAEKSRRWICQVVETLVLLHHLPIGASRTAPMGYFLIETQADLDLAINARWKEVFAHMRYLRALTSKQDVARLFGQAQLQLDSENEEKGYGHGV